MNDLNSLRTHLFETLAAVREGKMDLDRARTVNEIGKTLIDSAKVEVDFIRATDGDGSSFLKLPAEPPKPDALPPGVLGITQHRLR